MIFRSIRRRSKSATWVTRGKPLVRGQSSRIVGLDALIGGHKSHKTTRCSMVSGLRST